MRDELDTIFVDEQFAKLFPTRGKPGEAPWRLALVTIMQFAENLSDRQAADAVRSRIDWKYALSLELADPGFDHTVLSEFRSRLINNNAEMLILNTLLMRFREMGLLKARGKQRTDSTHVLAAVRALNRLQLIRETMRYVLDSLALLSPTWLHTHANLEWAARYERSFGKAEQIPKSNDEQRLFAEKIGRDGFLLLDALYATDAPDAPVWLRYAPCVQTLRKVWVQNFTKIDGQLRYRTTQDGIPPSAQFISSPHDLEAHYSRKHTTSWIGYKVYLTETCEDEDEGEGEDDAPNLIINVETTSSPVPDGAATPSIHASLQQKGLLPNLHLVDMGFLDAELIVTSKQEYGIDLFGPSRPDYGWQAKAKAETGQGFDAQSFVIDWEHKKATCPEGKESASWLGAIDKWGNHVQKAIFSSRDCVACKSQRLCIRSYAQHPRRTITVRPQEQHQALQKRREQEKTEEYSKIYAKRAGIEGTISQGVRRCGMRRTRYIGLAKTHLSHLLTAAAIDFIRVAEWLAGKRQAQTRRSPFSLLMAKTSSN